MKPDLFICHTQYHVLATLIKLISIPGEAEIILSETIPGRAKLAEGLTSCHLFKKVHCPEDEHLPLPPTGGLRVHFLHAVQRRAYKQAGFSLDPLLYKNICIYNDMTALGRWLQDYRCSYILGEDTRNHLAKPDNEHIDAQQSSPGFEYRRRRGIGYLYQGLYKGVAFVEVSTDEGVPYYQGKLKVIDPLKLLQSFTEEQKESIRRVFVHEELPEIGGSTCLLLPRSFYVDHDLPTQEAQNELCKSIVKQYAHGYTLFIKTHPRDTTDYHILFPDAVVLDRFMPSELLDYCFNIHFSRAVGLCTASVANLKCADEKISLGYDILQPYL